MAFLINLTDFVHPGDTALVGECSSANITGLTVPKSIKAVMPIVDLASGDSDSPSGAAAAPAAKDGPGPSGGTGSGDDGTQVTHAPKPKPTGSSGSSLVGAAGRSSTIASGSLLVIAVLAGMFVL
jgi:hypothetical protein